MTDPIYFQWQNDTLLKTIYPKRKEKLIDFLVHFEEIELWKKHEKMPKAEFTRRKKQYEKKQAQILDEIVKVYNREKDYFLDEDGAVSAYAANYSKLKNNNEEDADELERIRSLHKTFQLIDPKGKNIYGDDIRKEKIFVAQRVMAWEEYRQKVTDRIFRQRRRTNSIGENIRVAENQKNEVLVGEFQKRLEPEQDELERLENQLLKMVDDEMSHLSALSSAYAKYEKRKLAVKKSREKQQDELERKLVEFRKKRREVRQAEEELRSVEGWIRRFDAMQSHEEIEKIVEDTEKTVLGDVDLTNLKKIFGTETVFLDRFIGNRNYLIDLIGATSGKDVKLTYVRRALENIKAIKVDIDGKIDKLELDDGQKGLIPELQAIILWGLMPEVEKLADYQFALDCMVNKKAEKMFAELLEQNQAREKQIQKDLKAGGAALTKLQKEIAPIKARLDIPEEEELVQFVPEKEITVNEIVIEMANEYRESLANKTHEELLEIIVKLFWDYPERFPLWLQYMVIHFSGMRYASAHGSWADPKELLGNLLTSRRGEENRVLVDEDEVETQAQAWLRYLRSDGDQIEVEGEEPITLPLSKLKDVDKDDEKEKGEDESPKIASFSADLEGNFYTKRKALYNLKMLQDKYRIEAMSDQDVLDELKDINEQKDDSGEKILPDWMWNEIVAMTDLRLQEAQDPNWEKLTPEQEVEKNSGKWEKYRAIMNKWKAENLTDWRKEHETTGQLIVTRAVCNEVAEHIQHMRGLEGAAGLTEKPNWYKREEREFNAKWPRWRGERPYFKRPRLDSDFKEGASLLWLRYVRDNPDQWRIAQPLDTDEGDGLIRAEYLRKRAPGNWVYTIEDGIPRRRSITRNRVPQTETQYLRWMHEATVAAVAETAEGTVVLTFETALPYEDRRLSTIGVFKRYPHDLMDDFGEDGYNPAFVGFVPEGELSEEKLKVYREMLDWNKILRGQFKPQAELDACQEKYIRSSAVQPTNEIPKDKITSEISKDKITRTRTKVPEEKLYRVRIWGDEIMIKQGFDVVTAKTTNFQAVKLYNKVTGFGDITNFLRIDRNDIENLRAMQEPTGQFSIDHKMNWLCVFRGKIYMYDNESDEWRTAESIRWGTIALGGNLVQVDGFEDIEVKLPGDQEKAVHKMARLVGFKKSDWERPLDELVSEGLVHRCYCAGKNNKFEDTPKGIVYSPFYSPSPSNDGWLFIGKNKPQPEALYIPFAWLERYPGEPKIGSTWPKHHS